MKTAIATLLVCAATGSSMASIVQVPGCNNRDWRDRYDFNDRDRRDNRNDCQQPWSRFFDRCAPVRFNFDWRDCDDDNDRDIRCLPHIPPPCDIPPPPVCPPNPCPPPPPVCPPEPPDCEPPQPPECPPPPVCPPPPPVCEPPPCEPPPCVPTPGTAALFGMGSLMLARRRRA